MSELLAGVRNKLRCFPRQVWALLVLMTLLNAVNFGYAIYDCMSEKKEALIVTYVWFPLGFVLFMATLLLVAIIRVYRTLRDENLGQLNNKYMTLHASLLFILAGALTVNYLIYFDNDQTIGIMGTFIAWIIYISIDFMVTAGIAVIMIRISKKKLNTIVEMSESFVPKARLSQDLETNSYIQYDSEEEDSEYENQFDIKNDDERPTFH